MEKIKCKKCGYEWIPRTDNPKVCSRCKSYYWNFDKKNDLEI